MTVFVSTIAGELKQTWAMVFSILVEWPTTIEWSHQRQFISPEVCFQGFHKLQAGRLCPQGLWGSHYKVFGEAECVPEESFLMELLLHGHVLLKLLQEIHRAFTKVWYATMWNFVKAPPRNVPNGPCLWPDSQIAVTVVLQSALHRRVGFVGLEKWAGCCCCHIRQMEFK
jgi:hypothetical protein